MMIKTKSSRNPVPKGAPICSEMELHAYVDGELSNNERAFVLEASRKSAEICNQLNELEQIKQLVRISYSHI